VDSNPIDRMIDSLQGLSVGDAFGETFFGEPAEVEERLSGRVLDPAPWFWTDDTAMALAVVEVMSEAGRMDRSSLAAALGRRYDPLRGFGAAMHDLLESYRLGGHWSQATTLFEGDGSWGNGAAMRSAPIGAYHAGDPTRAATEAAAGAIVTHAHTEGVAGAVAVAVAASLAAELEGRALLEAVAAATPPGDVARGMRVALLLDADNEIAEAVGVLGNGEYISAVDTVPFALWCAAWHLDEFEEGLWRCVAGLGDRDTTCAIAGGVMAARVGVEGIPQAWLEAREPLPALGPVLAAEPAGEHC
jgi:ADP-ribosylglycohydrolase